MNVFTLLDQTARRYPDHVAVYRGDREMWTYDALLRRSLALAAGLLADGARGDRVVVAAKNDAELIAVMFAVWAAGMVLAPLNAKLHPRELAEIAANAEARWLFVDRDLAPGLAPLTPGAVNLVEIGSARYEAMASGEAAVPAKVEPTDLAWLFYTSGTTGRSKGAMLSHRNLMAMTLAHLADFEALTPQDQIIHAAPMSHGSGLYVLPYTARGASHVVPVSQGYDVAEFLELCRHHRRCGAFLAPTMVHRLREGVEARGTPAQGLRSIIYGGGPMYVKEIKRSLALFGPILCHLYGQGEAPMTISGLRADEFREPSDDLLGSVGWPRTGLEIRIVQPDGTLAAHGEAGEIECRGDVVMSGYWRDPSATADALCDGWLRTGDIGSVDRSGLLTLRDRSKEVIISGGSNIYPREVEEAILSHIAVREVAVLGKADQEWGESVVAFVVINAGAQVDAPALDRHCLERIARFKRPKEYIFLAELPKSSSGKVLKRELARTLEGSDPV